MTSADAQLHARIKQLEQDKYRLTMELKKSREDKQDEINKTMCRQAEAEEFAEKVAELEEQLDDLDKKHEEICLKNRTLKRRMFTGESSSLPPCVTSRFDVHGGTARCLSGMVQQKVVKLEKVRGAICMIIPCWR